MAYYTEIPLRIRMIFLVLLCTKAAFAWVTRGTTFEFVFISNINPGALYVHVLGRENTTLTFDGPYTALPIQATISSTEIISFKLDSTFSADITASDIQKKGMSIESSDDIIIYLMNYESTTTDGCLLLPLPPYVFGETYRYIAVTYSTGGSSTFQSLVGIVAFYRNTNVEITVRLKGILDHVLFQGVKYKNGAVITTTLDKHDVIQLVGDTDMTGTIVDSDKPISLFSGANCANIPTSSSACDYIMEQIPPISDWGVQFVTSPLKSRSAGDVFRVLAANDRTTVNTTTDIFPTLNQGEFYEWEIASNKSVVITSSTPILLVQYAKSYLTDKVGDPAMLIVPPTDQFQVLYQVYVPTSFSSYASLVVPSAFVDSLVVDQSFLTGATVVEILEHVKMTVLQIQLDSGQHLIWSPNNTQFGLQAYGFGPAEVSYAFTSGGISQLPFVTFDLCTPNPCMNDAVCLNLQENFVCICKSGFSGTLCDVAEILSTSVTESSVLVSDVLTINATVLDTNETVLATDAVILTTNATLSSDEIVLTTNATLISDDIVLTTDAVILTTNATLPSDEIVLTTNATLVSDEIVVTTNATLVSDEIVVTTNATLVSDETVLTTNATVLSDDIVLTTDGVVITSNATVLATDAAILTVDPVILTSDTAVVATEVVLNTETAILMNESTVLTNESVFLATDSALPANVSAVLTTESVVLTNESATLATDSAILNTDSAGLVTETQTLISDDLILDPSSTDVEFSTLLATEQLTTYEELTVTASPLEDSVDTTWTELPVILNTITPTTECPCICVATTFNRTEEEIRLLLEAIRNNLTVNTKTLSATIRKKISIYDERPSAVSVGFSGVFILTSIFSLLVLMDCSVLKHYCSVSKKSSFNLLRDS